MKVLSTYQVGEDSDVLAYDPGLRSLYVSAKSGAVTIFQSMARALLYSAPWRSIMHIRYRSIQRPISSTSAGEY
jgi:hypothetical protein